MALFDNIVNGGNLWAGLAMGAGALIVWPLIGPVLLPIATATTCATAARLTIM